MNKVLVTGSNGFVGSTIAARLKKSFVVYGSGRQMSSAGECNHYFRWDLGCEPEPKELQDAQIDYVVHAAASLEMDDQSDSLLYTNCIGTHQIFKMAVNHRIKGIVFISSLPIIGNIHPIPITEEARICPLTMYHATKAAGEMIISQAARYGIRAISLRIPSPIGPGMRRNTIVPVFIQKALSGESIVIQGKGTRKQNYLDVRDLAEVVLRVIKTDDADGVFNVGGDVISNLELARKCVSLLKSGSRIEFSGKTDENDGIDWTTDNTKLLRRIGDYRSHTIDMSILDIAHEMM